MGEIPEVGLLHQGVNVYDFACYSNTSIEILPFFIPLAMLMRKPSYQVVLFYYEGHRTFFLYV